MATPKAAILCSDTSLQRLPFGNNHVFFGPVEYINTCLHLLTTGALISALKKAVMEDFIDCFVFKKYDVLSSALIRY